MIREQIFQGLTEMGRYVFETCHSFLLSDFTSCGL